MEIQLPAGRNTWFTEIGKKYSLQTVNNPAEMYMPRCAHTSN